MYSLYERQRLNGNRLFEADRQIQRRELRGSQITLFTTYKQVHVQWALTFCLSSALSTHLDRSRSTPSCYLHNLIWRPHDIHLNMHFLENNWIITISQNVSYARSFSHVCTILTQSYFRSRISLRRYSVCTKHTHNSQFQMRSMHKYKKLMFKCILCSLKMYGYWRRWERKMPQKENEHLTADKVQFQFWVRARMPLCVNRHN